MTEVEQQPQTNGIELIAEDEANKVRPADIEAVSGILYLLFLEEEKTKRILIFLRIYFVI